MAHFTKIPELVDLRGKTRRDGSYRDLGIWSKTDIAIHHSLTKTGNSYSFADYHVRTNGWPGVAYHFVILKDGTIQWNHNLGIKSYHVGNSNSFAVGVCVVGDFRYEKPTKAQKRSLKKLVKALKKDMPNYKRTRGHDEFPGYAWKQCPEFDYNEAINGNYTEKPAKPKTYMEKGDRGDNVRALQSSLKKVGYSVSIDGIFGPNTEKAVKDFQRNHNLTVDGLAGPNTLEKLNAVIAQQAKEALEEEEDMPERVIVINSLADLPAAEPLAARLECAIYFRNVAQRVSQDGNKLANHVYVVGGDTEGLKADKFTDLSGDNRYDTYNNVYDFFKK